MFISFINYENDGDEIISAVYGEVVQISEFSLERQFYEENVINFIGNVGLKFCEIICSSRYHKDRFYEDINKHKLETNIIAEVTLKLIANVFLFYFVEFSVNNYFKCNRIASRMKNQSKLIYYVSRGHQSIEVNQLLKKSVTKLTILVSSLNKKVKIKPNEIKRNIIPRYKYIPNSQKKPIIKFVPLETRKIKNFSIQNQRHASLSSILTIKLKTVLQCSNFKRLHKLLYHKLDNSDTDSYKLINQEVSTYCYNTLSVSSIFSQYFNQKNVQKVFNNQNPKLFDIKNSTIHESFQCIFPFKFICYKRHSEKTIISFLEKKNRLKVYCCNHSRIVIKINDYLLNEEDKKNCKIVVESNSEINLVRTLDTVNEVFPDWFIWKNGTLDLTIIV